ncbi:MAG: glycosyltransferase family 2 protein [Thermoanaerobaculia bacterium]
MDSPILTIAMPVFNEEAVIAGTVREALAALDSFEEPGEVLVINDGSTDRTTEVLTLLLDRDARLRVISNETNYGISRFNRQMIEHARGEWVFFIGSDGEWECAEAIRFLRFAREKNVEAVLGYRVRKQYGVWRSVVSASFNLLVFLCFGARFRDVGSIRLLKRSTFGALRLYSRSAFLNAERLLVGKRRGAHYLQVPVKHLRRKGGRGRGATPRRVLASLADLFRTRWRWFRFQTFYGGESSR